MSEEKTPLELEAEAEAELWKKNNPQINVDSKGEAYTTNEDKTAAEEKPKLTTDIEKELRQKRQAEMQGNESGNEDNTEAKRNVFSKLRIDELRKTNRGKTLILTAFIILALLSLVYFFPSILRGVVGGDDKPKPPPSVTTGDSHRLTGLSDDADPFGDTSTAGNGNAGGSSNAGNDGKGNADTAAPQTYSRALDGMMSSVQSDSGNRSSSSTADSKTTADNEGTLQANKSANDPDQVNADTISSEDNSTKLTAIRKLPYDPNLFIPENTAIPCSLDRRFVSDLAGRLTCTVNEDIYSANHNVKLIDKGTSASLVYRSTFTPKHGQGRVFLIATKLRTRTQPFIEIPLIDTGAAGSLGEAGVDGWIDTHFSDRFLGAMMLGIIPDMAQWASNASKNNKDNQTDLTENSRQAFADIARESFANSVNIPPTMYKNQGEIITLITGRDLDFSTIYKLKMRK